jgi:hypothetical protein
MIRLGCMAFALVIGAAGEDPAPKGVVQGTFLEYSGSDNAGDVGLRTSDNHVYWFRFDSRTLFESAGDQIAASKLAPGDRIEVISDGPAVAGARYARIVRVTAANGARRFPTYRTRYRIPRDPTEDILPRGNLTFAGIVRGIQGGVLDLKLRSGVEKRILLRDDTRYMQDGLATDLSALSMNTRVFVRAGETLDQVEAYQVVWGKIFNPR